MTVEIIGKTVQISGLISRPVSIAIWEMEDLIAAYEAEKADTAHHWVRP